MSKRKLLFFIIIIVALLMLNSCALSDGNWPQGPNKFIITDINDGITNHSMSIYTVEMPSQSTTKISRITFNFADTKGKFQVGDILSFHAIEVTE